MMKSLFLFCLLLLPATCVWAQNKLVISPSHVTAHITPYLYGAGMEDVNHEIYGGFYDQQLFGESFEEGVDNVQIKDFKQFDQPWKYWCGTLYIDNHKTAKLLYDQPIADATVEVDLRYDELPGNGKAGGLILRVGDDCTNGIDSFSGYEISLHGKGDYIVLGKHAMNWQPIANYPVKYVPTQWNHLKVSQQGSLLKVWLNGQFVCEYNDTNAPLLKGRVGLRVFDSPCTFCHLQIDGREIPFEAILQGDDVSRMWKLFSSPGSQAEARIISQDVFHGHQAQLIGNKSATGIVGISNMGLNRWGIGLKQGQTFQGHVWLKGDADQVYVALRSGDGKEEYDCRQLKGITNQWKRFDFRLKSTANGRGQFVIYIKGKGTLIADAAELMHTGKDQYKGLPLRADVGEMFTRQHLTFLRYGGSMVNASEYRYANMRGERSLRPPYQGWWYRFSTNGFGINEFVDFTQKQGYESSFAINIEENPDDAAQMIRDLKGRIHYVEIGNEEVIFIGDRKEVYEHYVERFLLLREAMLKVDPKLKFICSAWWRPKSEYCKQTFLALDGKADYWDYHPWVNDYKSALKVYPELQRMQQLFYEWNPNTKMRCAVLEENGSTHHVGRMLCHVIAQNAVRRMGEFVLTTCPANALEPYQQNDNGWNQGQIFFNPDMAWGMPPYYAQQQSALHHQPLLVESALQSVNPNLDITATRSKKGNNLVLHIVNIGERMEPCTLELQGSPLPAKAQMITLSGEETDDNLPECPEKIFPVEQTINPQHTITLPAHSYTIIDMKL